MFCNHCGNRVPDHSVHCPYCGYAVESSPADGVNPEQDASAAAGAAGADAYDEETASESAYGLPAEPAADAGVHSADDIQPSETAFRPAGGEEVIYSDREWYDGDPDAGYDEGYTAVRREEDVAAAGYSASYSPASEYDDANLPAFESDERFQDMRQADFFDDELAPSRVKTAGRSGRDAYDARRRSKAPYVTVAVVLIAAIAVAVYFLVRARMVGGTPLSRLAAAVEAQDDAVLTELLTTDENGAALTAADLQPFMALLKDQAYRSRLAADLRAGTATDILVTETEQTTIFALRLYKLRVTTDPAGATMAGHPLTAELAAKNGMISAGPWPAGQYQMTVRYPGIYGVESSGIVHRVNLSYASEAVKDGVYILDASADVVQLKFDDAYPAARILINGQPIDQTVDQVLEQGGELGPVLKGSNVALQLQTPAGVLTSETVKAAASSDPVVFVFRNAWKLDGNEPEDDVFVNGEAAGKVSDYRDFGYLVAPHTADYRVTTGYSKVTVTEGAPADPVSSARSSGVPAATGTAKGSSGIRASEATAGRSDGTTASGAPVPTGSTTETTPSRTAVPTTTAAPTTVEPPATTVPSDLPYSAADLAEAGNGIMSAAIKEDILKAIGTYIREDAEGASKVDIGAYSNLAEPQLGRHRDWINELKRNNMRIEYQPQQVDIWTNSWRISYEDGELKAHVIETYHTKYQVIQDGNVVESEAVADRWIHYLRYDTDRRMWVIYQNEVPEQSGPNGPVESFGF